MYNHLLDTFKAVAEEGSFLKAAEKHYITHTAVRKQMGQLEDALGVRLFDRSQRGAALTPAGKVLYAEALNLMKESDRVKEKVSRAAATAAHIVRVGTSSLYPCHAFMDLWDEIQEDLPEWRLKVVTYNDETTRIPLLGDLYDFVVGPYNIFDEGALYGFEHIGSYRFAVSVPRTHPLSKREELALSDLEGYPLMVMAKGFSPINDEIRSDIQKDHSGINIVDISPNYDMAAFNHAVETGSLLLSISCWDRVHPEMKNIPLTEGYEIPFGMTYLKSSDVMNEFATCVRLVSKDLQSGSSVHP